MDERTDRATPDADPAVVRRLGAVERELGTLRATIESLEARVGALVDGVDVGLPRLEQQVTATSAMADAVAAQVAADTAAIMERLGMGRPGSQVPGDDLERPAWWRRLRS